MIDSWRRVISGVTYEGGEVLLHGDSIGDAGTRCCRTRVGVRMVRVKINTARYLCAMESPVEYHGAGNIYAVKVANMGCNWMKFG